MRIDLSKEELKAQFRFMQIQYLRKLITKMQCADMGVVNDETYNTAIARLMELVDEDKNYWDKFEDLEGIKC